ncbi:hypothetical protein R3P38DRAFT_2493225 [Favolaschia claudopus]|uniref:Uncharacterized protein n=1 Tax=Favolaschia claudopus TaxID=2862362 RepID=A0AAW0EI41_9AGAR
MTRYRLGYSPQRPYPWLWTTPLAILIMLTAAILFILVNSPPASAYETVQEFTYFPNSSVPPPPLSGLVPSALRQSTNHFSPQHLDVGQSFRLNNSALSYTIGSAFDSVENGRPVTSFPYYNNPFSEGCDVTNVSAVVQTHTADSAKRYQYYDYSVSGFVTCTSPTSFEMSWNFDGGSALDTGLSPSLLDVFGRDLVSAAFMGYSSQSSPTDAFSGQGVIRVTARPCCTCNARIDSAALQEDRLQLTSEPCRSQTSQFIGLTGQLTNTTSNFAPWGYYWSVTNTTSLFSGADPQFRKGYIGVNDLSALDTPFQNLFQIMYHLVRSDLGVVFNNQIFDSADMFNKSILALDVPADLITYDGSPFGTLGPSAANTMRAATSNPTMMEEWRKSVALMTGTDRVPVLEYLRPVSRRKSLGSAIVAVFVATFTMLSAVWTIFGLVAQGLVKVSQQDKGASRVSSDYPLFAI